MFPSWFLALFQVTKVSNKRYLLFNSVLLVRAQGQDPTPLVLISICLNYEHFPFLLSTDLFLPASSSFFFFFTVGKVGYI